MPDRTSRHGPSRAMPQGMVALVLSMGMTGLMLLSVVPSEPVPGYRAHGIGAMAPAQSGPSMAGTAQSGFPDTGASP